MNKFANLTIAITATVLLAGCSYSYSPPSDGTGVTNNGNYGITTIKVDYKDLRCVTWQGYSQEIGVDCDWVAYHLTADSKALTKAENAELHRLLQKAGQEAPTAK